MATHYLEFEKPIAELEAKIAELSHLAPTSGSFETEIAALRKKADALRVKTYANLDPWMRTQVARHPQRPHFVDYIDGLQGWGGARIVVSCYANCDGSTGTPALSANDFQCFLNKFAQADPYANCDQSTGTPALTANDFQCFLNAFAGGCP